MNNLTEGNELHVILKFTLPILLGNIFQQFYNIADSIIVGKFLGPSSLAAISSSFNIINLILLIAMGLTLGTNILTARFFGAKDIIKIKSTIDTSFILSTIISFLITVLGFIFINNLLNFFYIPQNIFEESSSYLKLLLIGTFFIFSYNNLCSIFRGLGNSKIPLYFIIISTILNIIFDYIFILVFNLGSNGAAISTVISQGICFFGALIYFNTAYNKFKINLISLKFDLNIFISSFKIGFPAAVQKFLISLGLILIQILTNSFGTTVIAGFAAASKLDSFAQIPSANIGDALSVFTSQNIGAEKTDRIKKGFKSTLLISTILCFIITLICLLFSSSLMKLFTNDTNVISIGEKYIKTISLFYIFYSIMVISNGLLLGYGNTSVPLIGTIFSFVCFQVPLSIFLSRKIGPSGIYLAMPGGWIIGLLIRLYFVNKIILHKSPQCKLE